jgi:glycopeptide antibiotics resistance protein
MKQRQNIFEKPLNLLFVLATILVIVIATLYPFNFSFPHSFSVADFFDSFNHASSFQDKVNNVLLFMPFGFACANLLQKLKFRFILQILIVLLISFGLTLTVETLQIFLPSRSSTPADIFNNTLGGCLGFLSFYFWNYQSLTNTISPVKKNNSRLSNQKIIEFILGYISFIFLISLLWISTTNLSNWDLKYPLILGNESTGNRPWQGYISEVYFTDKAISIHEARKGLKNPNYFNNFGDSLLANYQLNGQSCYQEKTGKLPELLWQGKPTNLAECQGIFLNSSQWLKTAGSVKNLNQGISKASEFTLFVSLATDNTQQTGPARIISISGDSLRRNLTLSQQENYLDLRLRTPLTGENGTDLQLRIPKVFTDNKFHQLIITYSRGIVQVYIDKVQRFYSFNLLELIPLNQKLFYYALIFMPLGASLAILNFLAKSRVLFSRVLIPAGIVLPSMIMETILVSESHKNLSWKNIFLGILFTAGTMLIFQIRAKYLKAGISQSIQQ